MIKMLRDRRGVGVSGDRGGERLARGRFSVTSGLDSVGSLWK